ncbi:hypothetical protein OCV62_14600 [Gallintestinimicrobium propionicum]|uniref:hypothetical protein n=1 Tax=Gallintestinimicrobium propionicum TaxID=2981770 RepID=UPI000AD0A568|nr:hypothetical protein [Gallintestinimicrobium propionicum]MCU6691175.1 hypothetical protein [Gallintestinimicrobium propionicum]
MEYHAIEDAEAWHKIQDVLEERVKAGVEIKNDLIRMMGEFSETTFQKIVDFERSFLLCLIAGTGNLHG